MDATRKRLISTGAGALCLLLALGGGWMMFAGERPDAPAAVADAAITGSVDDAPKVLGPSGLPIPRFVSLKAAKVNVRKGPASDYPVAWVFERKGMPVEIVAEFENWRRIRDSDGAEGWILQNMLTGKRMAAAAPWKPGNVISLHAGEGPDTGLVARVGSGAIGEIEECSGDWCHVSFDGYDGYMEQAMIWGVYPGERVND